MFVFYFGIMADVTPPVGLASFAAAAISGEDPIKTGLQGSVYALRTAILPFVFVYNPQLLLIDIHEWWEFLIVIGASTLAILMFSAVCMNFLVVRSRWYETAALALACFTLFHPGYWVDQVYPATKEVSPAELEARVAALPTEGRIGMVIEGLNLEGEDVRKSVSLPVGQGTDGKARLAAAGLRLSGPAEEPIVGNVGFGSAAKRVGFEQGFKVTALVVPNEERPSHHLLLIPATGLVLLVYLLQRGRRKKAA
jgi:hypothetical protein